MTGRRHLEMTLTGTWIFSLAKTFDPLVAVLAWLLVNHGDVKLLISLFAVGHTHLPTAIDNSDPSKRQAADSSLMAIARSRRRWYYVRAHSDWLID